MVHFQHAEVSLITWRVYYKGSSSQVLVCAFILGDLSAILWLHGNWQKNLKLSENWRYPYVAMGLHIPHPPTHLIGLLRSSGSWLVWNGLQLASIDVVKQRSEDLPCSLRATNTLVRYSYLQRELIAKEVHMYGKSQTLSSSRRTKCCWSPLILLKHTLALVNRPWLRKELFFPAETCK